MNEVWNKVYKSDSTFFGEEPSNFALLCFNDMKTKNIEKVLDLGAGHGERIGARRGWSLTCGARAKHSRRQ